PRPVKTFRVRTRTFQRAPGAKPRRSGSTPRIPGHQSARWYGSARNAQTSARGASSSREALAMLGRGDAREELRAAEHPLELLAPAARVQGVDARMGRVAGHLLDAEVALGGARDLGQVRDRHHLRALREPPERAGD